jgi:predicted PurR-regulated permease PerM
MSANPPSLASSGWTKALIVLASLSLGLYLANALWQMAIHFSDVIITFFLAWLLAFVLAPLVSAMGSSWGIPRAVAATLVYVLLFLNVGIVLVLVVPLAVEQAAQLVQNAPAFFEGVQGWLLYIQSEARARGVEVDLSSVYSAQDLARQATVASSAVAQHTISLVSGVASALFGLALVVILSFYFVLDGDRLLERCQTLIPESLRGEADYFVDSVGRTFGGFLRGTLIVALLYAIGTAAIMASAGLPFVLLASLLAGVFMVVPFIGPALAMVLPVVLAAQQGPLARVLFVVIGLLVIQFIILNVVSPKVMGESLGMHPMLVFLALLVGIKEAGLAGAIFGVPVVGVVYAMFTYVIRRRREAAVGTAEDGTARPPARPPPAAVEPLRRLAAAIAILRDGNRRSADDERVRTGD